jgi:hypothetical protein
VPIAGNVVDMVAGGGVYSNSSLAKNSKPFQICGIARETAKYTHEAFHTNERTLGPSWVPLHAVIHDHSADRLAHLAGVAAPVGSQPNGKFCAERLLHTLVVLPTATLKACR